MTISDIVLSQRPAGINEWLAFCKKNNFNEKITRLIIDCADYHNMIIVNHSASFTKAINL